MIQFVCMMYVNHYTYNTYIFRRLIDKEFNLDRVHVALLPYPIPFHLSNEICLNQKDLTTSRLPTQLDPFASKLTICYSRAFILTSIFWTISGKLMWKRFWMIMTDSDIRLVWCMLILSSTCSLLWFRDSCQLHFSLQIMR